MKENLLKETQQAHNKPFSGNIVLIGFMGAGKSTVSEYLSRKYNMDTVEMDQIIAERGKNEHFRYFFQCMGKNISGIWKQICLLKCRQRPIQ